MVVRPIDAIELRQRMCALCNQAHYDEPCEPSDCVFVRAINEAPTLTPPNEWISVDERLPDEELNQFKKLFPGENEVGVLVMIEGAYIATTLYWDGEKFYDETSTYEVTHWMPLPTPPEN